MDYHAQITAIGAPDRMMKVLEAEEKNFARSSYTIEKKQDGLVFNIRSKDPTALRATLNTITQFLVIYHNLKQMTQAQKAQKADKPDKVKHKRKITNLIE
ncbi:MAG: hypothetical protein HZB67_04575 [Candidatus Aenigmarchaeota archaeon]|nr:hypothetical protein [Candidatus Aenigmarchaeota archaeon]